MNQRRTSLLAEVRGLGVAPRPELNHGRARVNVLVIAAWLAWLPWAVSPAVAQKTAEQAPLEMEFLDARPMVQLFKAYAEFKMGNYDLAWRMFEAVKGPAVPEARFNLGVMAEDGLGRPADMDLALRYYTGAAAAGNRPSQYRLGRLYLTGGAGHPADVSLARHWLTRAAQGGDDDAAALLAGLSASVPAEPDDLFGRARRAEALGRYPEAAALYRRLAESGNARAMTRLAWLYEAGLDGTRDLEAAAELFEAAARLGDAEAQYALGVMLSTGAGREKNPRLARDWLEKAAAQGHQGAGMALRP